MTGFDYVVFAVLALSSVLGLWRGLASEVLALAAWVAAFFAARSWGHVAADVLSRWLHDPVLLQGAGFVAVFAATLLLFAVVRFLLAQLLRAVGLGLIDRFFGALFGVIRGVLMVLAGVLVCGMTNLPRETWWREAWLSAPLETAVMAGRPWLPPTMAQRIRYR